MIKQTKKTGLYSIRTRNKDDNQSLCAPTGGKNDKSKSASECTPAETRYGKCVPDSGDCGEGLREATCKDRTDKIHCKIPCNWKKDISESHTHTHTLLIITWGDATVRRVPIFKILFTLVTAG